MFQFYEERLTWHTSAQDNEEEDWISARGCLQDAKRNLWILVLDFWLHLNVPDRPETKPVYLVLTNSHLEILMAFNIFWQYFSQ